VQKQRKINVFDTFVSCKKFLGGQMENLEKRSYRMVDALLSLPSMMDKKNGGMNYK
jgi:hypothetical protein